MVNEDVSKQIISVSIDKATYLSELAIKEVFIKLSQIKDFVDNEHFKKIYNSNELNFADIQEIKINKSIFNDFDLYAKKYDIKYAVYENTKLGKVNIFFKSKDIDKLKECFSSFANENLKNKDDVIFKEARAKTIEHSKPKERLKPKVKNDMEL